MVIQISQNLLIWVKMGSINNFGGQECFHRIIIIQTRFLTLCHDTCGFEPIFCPPGIEPNPFFYSLFLHIYKLLNSYSLFHELLFNRQGSP